MKIKEWSVRRVCRLFSVGCLLLAVPCFANSGENNSDEPIGVTLGVAPLWLIVRTVEVRADARFGDRDRWGVGLTVGGGEREAFPYSQVLSRRRLGGEFRRYLPTAFLGTSLDSNAYVGTDVRWERVRMYRDDVTHTGTVSPLIGYKYVLPVGFTVEAQSTFQVEVVRRDADVNHYGLWLPSALWLRLHLGWTF